jgi:hypothetical protein
MQGLSLCQETGYLQCGSSVIFLSVSSRELPYFRNAVLSRISHSQVEPCLSFRLGLSHFVRAPGSSRLCPPARNELLVKEECSLLVLLVLVRSLFVCTDLNAYWPLEAASTPLLAGDVLGYPLGDYTYCHVYSM